MILFTASTLHASGKCPKCGKTWSQTWAKDFSRCPEDGALLTQVAGKQAINGQSARALKIVRVNKEFSNYYRYRKALCVGINSYKEFPTLEYALSDAQSIASVLRAYDFEEVTLITDQKATKRKIVNELLRFKSESEEEDLFVFYFAGHGTAQKDHEGKEQGYLIPVDCTGEMELYEQGISMGLFKDICSTMPNKHILFLIDCCYSGYGLTRSSAIKTKPSDGDMHNYLKSITSRRAVQILTAGGKNDLAHERGGHGIFTSYLLEVLEGRTSHKDDGIISTLEMSSYIKQNVINQTRGKQNPAFGYLDGNGDVVFITGRQERETFGSQDLLSLKDIDVLYIKAGELSKKGEYLLAEREMSKAYTHFRRHDSRDTTKNIQYLKRLTNVSNKMLKSDMAIYYAQELLGSSVIELELAFAYSEIGVSHKSKGDYDRASEYFERALKINLMERGSNHPKVAACYNDLGKVYRKKGEYDQAIEYFEKALAIYRAKLGPDHALVTACYLDLGEAFRNKGNNNQAIKYFKKALKIDLARLGSDHPRIAASYLNLGIAYQKKGNQAHAIEYFEKALKIDLKKLGPDHPKIAACYIYLGVSYRNKREYDRAIEYFERALKIDLEKLGSEHPNIAKIYDNMGTVYKKKKDFNLAEESYQKAIDIGAKKLGRDHPATVKYQKHLDSLRD